MLVVQVVLDIEFGVFLQRLGRMEVAGSLTPIDGNLWISGSVNNLDDIPIGLRTVGHETFEMRLGDAMASRDVVEVMLEKHLSIFIFELEIAASDGHNALVGSIVYVAYHGGPLGDTFDMIGHDPNVFKIPARLHAHNQVDPTTRVDLIHLEYKNLVHVVTMAWELIQMDIGLGADTSKLGDAIHIPQPT